ncbi:hypothetical protein IE81DRAFT_325253 [Ceraceosorus guamensis]|uniref:Uncharacterized protein n=1 Tax=Ceraceosorus guamensis TaxID=1522189 RepID=A0A316VU28_9BASI|nr:hypothetical protein IE81DRAFT_325253 [Ceraceosorus guamensis]PWN40724.1 hypothetical protein IE81DRAFT_325253 [Ceraceosorus guamensis]
MKLYISTLLSIIVTLLCLARTGEASPLVVPSRQQQRKTCGNLIRGKPLLVKFCRAYLGNYRPAVLASTTTATITATSTPPPITVTVATTTSTVTSTM